MNTLSQLLSNASLNAAAWYQTVAGGNPNTAVSNVAAANVAGSYATSTAALAQTNPLLAGILNNPTIILIIGLIAVAVIVLAIRS